MVHVCTSRVTYMDESWCTCAKIMTHTNMSQVSHTQRWVKSHLWLSHVQMWMWTWLNRVMSRCECGHDSITHETWLIWICHIHMPHSHVNVAYTPVKQSCQCAVSHISVSHVTHMNTLWHTHEWVMSLRSGSNAPHPRKSCRTHQISHVVLIYGLCHTHHTQSGVTYTSWKRETGREKERQRKSEREKERERERETYTVWRVQPIQCHVYRCDVYNMWRV